jgi:uncharacterized membrane protein
MNLDLSWLGWVHAIASIGALATGAWMLLQPKGTSQHRSVGRLYLMAMLVTNLTALGIYRSGIFFFPHWFALAALTTIAIGFLSARLRWLKTHWRNAHLTCMVASYYMLVGGGVNEMFLRIHVLHAMAPDVLNSPLIGMVHFANMTIFAILIAYFNVRYWNGQARLTAREVRG